MTNPKTLGVALVAVIVIAIGGYVFPKVQVQLGANPGPVHLEYQEFEGGVKFGSSVASTSVGSGTLKMSDVYGYDTVILTPTGAEETKTLTFFASSSVRAWLPEAGDMQNTCFVNASTSAAATITWAAGTGIDLEYASSTILDGGPTLIQAADSTLCFTFIRKSKTSTAFDIEAAMQRFVDAD